MRRFLLAVAVAAGIVLIASVWIIQERTGFKKAHPSAPPSETNAQPTSGTLVRVRVVGLDQQPLRDMLPIATETPNAFDKPLAQGKPTDAQGRSSLVLDPNRWLYVRAWDPTLRFFANNYFDVPAGQADVAEELVVVMVEGARLRATLFTPEGNPVANENVGLMMFHPEKGPWWPAEADTDTAGNVVFERVPAGQFLLALKTVHSGRIDLPAVFLPPAGDTHLGNIQLLPE